MTYFFDRFTLKRDEGETCNRFEVLKIAKDVDDVSYVAFLNTSTEQRGMR